MIRRKFMKFAPKENSHEKVRKNLEKHNVPVYEGDAPAKFGQFGSIAKDIAAKSRKTLLTEEGGSVAPADRAFAYQQKAVYGDGGSYNQSSNGGNSNNPYAVSQPAGNPYAPNQPRQQPYSQSSPATNPYGQPGQSQQNQQSRGQRPGQQPGQQPGQGNPYGEPSANPYGDLASQASNPYGASSGGAGGAASNPYGGAPSAYQLKQNEAYEASQRQNYQGNPYADLSNQAGSSSASVRGAPSMRGAPSVRGAPSIRGGAPSVRGGAASVRGGAGSGVAASSAGATSAAASAGAFEDDELNQTHTELERMPDEGDELMHSNASIYNGRSMPRGGAGGASQMPGLAEEEDELNAWTPQRSRQASQVSGGPRSRQQSAVSGIGLPRGSVGSLGMGGMSSTEMLAPEDELNEMPSELMQAGGPAAGSGNGGVQLFEDSEDEDVENVKMEIRAVKNESLESTRRALQIAHEAETSGRNTLGMLGEQGERLGNSAKTVAIGNVQARVAERNADELQRLNRSIFIPNVSNPFNSRRRNQMREQKLKSERAYDELEQESLERLQRESDRRVTDGLNGSGDGYSETALRAQQRMNRDNPERKMYQFEADSEDEEIEDELAQNLEGISAAAKRLHGLSLKISDEVDHQNERIEQMGTRVDDLDFSLHKSTAKMATIN